MNKKILPSGILAALVICTGGILVVGPGHDSRARRGGAAVATPGPVVAARLTAKRHAPPFVPAMAATGRARHEVAAPRGGNLARRMVAEVFPDCEPPLGDWRNRHPAKLTVSPYPGITVGFQQVRTREDGRHLTWIGRNAELPGASFVGIATPDGYDAVMMIPGAGQYDFHVRDGQVLVEEVVATGSDCESGPAFLAAARLPVPAGVHYTEAGAGIHGDAAGNAASPRSEEAPATVDVLFLYNTRALAVAAARSNDPIGYMDGYTRAGIETCNLVLENSRIATFVWRYVGLVATPEYPEQVTVSDDLGIIGPDGALDTFVRSARAEYGADQVLMWTGAGTRQGAAFAGDVRSDPVPPEYAVAALRLTAGTLILGHELAHNFGCQHDRGHAGTGDGSTATPDGDGLWCYGLLWKDPVGTATSGTVMAYADFLVPYFSNPEITLNLTSTLENRPGGFQDFGPRTIGFPETDPRAANNARILREHGAYMAALNAAAEATPVILQQPANVDLSVGQVLSLRVSATGGGLAYQWLKEGTAIDGATGVNFARTVTATDAGSYSVRVSNGKGTVTSRAAVVTVAVAAPTGGPVSRPQASGGGGGGGIDPWFFLALLVAASLRMAAYGRKLASAARRTAQ